MEKTFNAVSLIQTISGKLRDEKLKNIPDVESEIKLLGEYLGTNTMQTVIFSAIYDKCAGGSYSDIDDVARYFECSALDIISYKRDIDDMLSRGLIEVTNEKMQFLKYEFKVADAIFEAIIDCEPIDGCKQFSKTLDQFEFVKTVGTWVENRSDEHVSTSNLFAMVSDLEKKYSSCEFVCRIKEIVPSIEDRILFYDTCKDSYFDNNSSNLEVTLKDIMDNHKELLLKMKTYIDETSMLHKVGLIKTWKDDDEYRMKPSRDGYEIFLGEFAECKMNKIKDLDKFEFVKSVDNYVQTRRRENNSFRRLEVEISHLEHENSNLDLVKKSWEQINAPLDRIFFYYLCNNYLDGRTYREF